MKKKMYYEMFIAILSLVAAVIILLELIIELPDNIAYILDVLDNMIWVIFLFDYVVRLIVSENKLSFIRNNKIDLISIVPFNGIFQSLRLFRFARILKLAKLIRLVRFVVLIYKFKSRADKFLKTNNFQYILLITIITVFIGAYGLSITEDKTFTDSLWWSFVTTTTVGYGDISPATISTYFLKGNEKDNSYRNEIIENIKEQLNDFESLSRDDLEDMCKVLLSLKDKG